MIAGTRYVIAVQNLDESSRYYQDVLGFEIREIDDPGWRFFVKDRCFIMAGECPNSVPARELGDHSYFAYFEVDNAETLYDELKAKQAQFEKHLRREPWGMQEFGIRTVDGHRIMFGSPIETDE